MPKWNGLTLTNLGKNLQAKCQAGTQLKFTRVRLGDGIHADTETLAEQTKLKNIRQTVNITDCKVNKNNQCEITCIISNANLEDGYYLRELGLYATDPDIGEILYAITLDVNPDFFPEDGGSVTLSETFNILINIGNITDVSAVIDVGGWVTSGYVMQQIKNHAIDRTAHYDMIGASTSHAGERGFVPKPAAGDPKRCLRADGTWGVPDNTKYTNMTGASTTAAGKSGLVPQPRAGDNTMFLKGDGTWDTPVLQFYPVGSIYLSVNSTSPASLFGGTWTRIKDRFLLAVGDKYQDVKAFGGEESHILTVNEMPLHNHSTTIEVNGAHTHKVTIASDGAHVHSATVTAAGEHSHKTLPYDKIGMDVSGSGSGTSIAIDCGDNMGWWNGERKDFTLTTAPAHTHSITIKSAGAHTHTATVSDVAAHNHTAIVGNTGGSAAHNNMPPYFTVYVWMRTA